MQTVWQVLAAETVVSTGRGATQSSPVLCRGTARTAAPLQRAVYWPPCVPGSEWQAARMCAAEANAADMCKVLVAAEAGSVRKDGGTALVPAAGLTKRRPVCGQHTEATDLRGCATQRHRSASLAEEKPHPERHRCSAHRCILEVLPWSRRCVPMRSCSSRGELPM